MINKLSWVFIEAIDYKRYMSLIGVAVFLAIVPNLVGCDSGIVVNCMPRTYQCGGQDNNIVEYCESIARRWQVLHDCTTEGQVCEAGKCVFPDETDDDDDNNDDTTDSDACATDYECATDYLCIDGTCDPAIDIRYDLKTAQKTLIYDNRTGRISVYGPGGELLLKEATSSIQLGGTDPQEFSKFWMDGEEGQDFRTVSKRQEHDTLGNTSRLLITRSDISEGLDLTWIVSAYPDHDYYTFQLRIDNHTGDTIRLGKAIALETAETETSGLFLGQNTEDHRILENGSQGLFDGMSARIVMADTQEPTLSPEIPGHFTGISASEMNHALYDVESGYASISGSLTSRASIPMVMLSYLPEKPVASPDGRIGFGAFSVESAYGWNPRQIRKNALFDSELIYFDPGNDDVLKGLELFASVAAAANDVVLWQDRAERRHIPGSWSSWGGAEDTGGYDNDIDEATILANLDFMAENFGDWGIDWFLIDAGWQIAWGDWEWDTARFPNGGKWLADRIREKGFKPGLWFAPFTTQKNSTIDSQNQSWLLQPTADVEQFADSELGLIDVTDPDVVAYLDETFQRFNDWGFQGVQIDHGYSSIFGTNRHDAFSTQFEAYRQGLQSIRDIVGEQTYLEHIGLFGPSFGLADSNRVTKDNAPLWENDSPDAPGGFKATMQNVTRRYYFHNRMWINHPGVLLFRSNGDNQSWPKVELVESQAYAAFAGMTGGLVRIGDRLEDMNVNAVNTVRKIVPVYEKGGRPLDLFARDYPEQWHLKVDKSHGCVQDYDILAFFNWGENRDLTQNPAVDIPDSQEMAIDFDLRRIDLQMRTDYHVFEFWSETCLGRVQDRIQASIPYHASRVYAVRKAMDQPQFVGWNRHLTMGAVAFESESWNEQTQELTIEFDVAQDTTHAPFPYRLYFSVPTGVTMKEFSAPSWLRQAKWDSAGAAKKFTFLAGKTEKATVTFSFETADAR